MVAPVISETFQFPSNGKAYLNFIFGIGDSPIPTIFVSIPFKRESVSERL